MLVDLCMPALAAFTSCTIRLFSRACKYIVIGVTPAVVAVVAVVVPSLEAYP